MKLAIVDISTKNHVSLILNWILIAQKNKWSVQLFVSTEVLKNIDEGVLRGVIVNEFKGGNAMRFLNDVYYGQCDGEIDKIVITSLQSNLFEFFFSKIRKCNTLLTIHNVNAWNGKCRKNTIKYFTKYILRYFLLKRASALVVSSENLANTLMHEFNVTKDIYIMPFKLVKEGVTENIKEYVVYPGIISKDRKQYQTFFKLCQQCNNVNFVLLGKAEGQEDKSIVDSFKQLPNVVTFDEYVTPEEFNYYINKAAVIFGELNVTYENAEFLEVYGKTKDTGLSYFTVESRVPLLVNDDFNNISNLQEMTFYYSSYHEAEMKLSQLIKKTELYGLSKLAAYRLCNVAERLYDI